MEPQIYNIQRCGITLVINADSAKCIIFSTPDIA